MILYITYIHSPQAICQLNSEIIKHDRNHLEIGSVSLCRHQTLAQWQRLSEEGKVVEPEKACRCKVGPRSLKLLGVPQIRWLWNLMAFSHHNGNFWTEYDMNMFDLVLTDFTILCMLFSHVFTMASPSLGSKDLRATPFFVERGDGQAGVQAKLYFIAEGQCQVQLESLGWTWMALNITIFNG